MIKTFSALTCLATSLLYSAGASAQSVSGQINITGFVADRCATDQAGTSTFSRSISLGELTSVGGVLAPNFVNSTETSPVASTQFLVGCTSTATTITLSATRLSNPAPDEGTSSSNVIDYTAEAKGALAGGGFATATYTTAATLPPATSVNVSSAFSFVQNNFEVRIYGLTAEHGNSSFLVAGNYTSTITVLVAPQA